MTGIIHFLESTPWTYYVGRQKTVESSTYGSEAVAGRIATEHIISHRNRVTVMGVPVTISTILVGDNCLVQTSGSKPSSSLMKKHLSIVYHKIRETVAAGIMLFAWIGTVDDLADLVTKPLNRLLTSYILFGKVKWLTKGSNKKKSNDE